MSGTGAKPAGVVDEADAARAVRPCGACGNLDSRDPCSICSDPKRDRSLICVVEGVGDHGCEYMTKGVVVVLGRCGRNFAAGMSGGIAYVYDEFGDFHDKSCNLASVDLEPLMGAEDVRILTALVEEHARRTGSPQARRILANWTSVLSHFVKVYPHELKRVLGVERRTMPYTGVREKMAAVAVEVQRG